KTADADGVATLYAYNSRGERVLTAVDLNANGAIDHGTDTVTLGETVPALDGGDPVWLTTSKVWQDGDTNPSAGTVVSVARQSPDGLFSASQSIGVANPATRLTVLSGSGDWTETATLPDGSYTVTNHVNGRPDIVEQFDADEN